MDGWLGKHTAWMEGQKTKLFTKLCDRYLHIINTITQATV